MNTRKYNKKKLIMYLDYGLANRIFQIIAGINYAEKWNMKLYISTKCMNDNDHVSLKQSIKDIQQLFPTIQFYKGSIKNFNNISLEIPFVNRCYNYKFIPNPKKDTILYGLFQNIKYQPKNDIRLNLIEPKDSVIKQITTPLFFIHIRLGDYINGILSFILKIDLTNYYKKCIEKILNNYSNATFIVISNDIINSIKYVVEKNLVNTMVYDKCSSRLDDLYYMSKCKGGICVHSTFSWIGAYSIKDKDKKNIFMPDIHNTVNIGYYFKDLFNPNDGFYPDWATKVDI